MLVLVGLLVLATRRVNAKLGDEATTDAENEALSGDGRPTGDSPLEDPAGT